MHQKLKVMLNIIIFLFLTFPIVISQNVSNMSSNVSLTLFNFSETNGSNETHFLNETNAREGLPVLILENIEKHEINRTLTLKISGWVGYSNGTGIYGAIVDVIVSSHNYTLSQSFVSDENGYFTAIFSGLKANQTYQITLSYKSQIIREEVKACDEDFVIKAKSLYTYQPINFTLLGNAPAKFEISFNQSKIYSIYIEGAGGWKKDFSLNLSEGRYLFKLYGECGSAQKNISVLLNDSQNISEVKNLELKIVGKNEFLQNETVRLEICLVPNSTVNCSLNSSNETNTFTFLIGNESCSILELRNLNPDNYTLLVAFQDLTSTHKFVVLPIEENLTEIFSINETLVLNQTAPQNITYLQNLTMEETQVNISESFQFPILITGENVEFNLDNDLVNQGILVFDANNATLNCNGKEIRGEVTKPLGIFVLKSKNVEIVNCKVNKFENGIVVFNSSNVKISNTQFYHNTNGLIFFFSDGISVSNVIALNNSGIGMFVYNSKISQFKNNQIRSTLGFSQLLKLEDLKKEVFGLISTLNL